RAGRDAADRPAGDAGAWLARRMAGDRNGNFADRFPAGLAADGAPAGRPGTASGRAVGWRLRVVGSPRRGTRAELLAPAGDGHRRILAAAALYGVGLSSPGGGEPAPGGASPRARHRTNHRRDHSRVVLANVGCRGDCLRAVAAPAAD